MKISVVIPCFNARRYVAAAVESVLAQRWPDLELLVVDDGSSDGSADFVSRAFPDVMVLRQDNGGAAAARNLGIRHAQGDWIAFLDADDVWLPGKLKVQAEHLSAAPAARMAYGAWQVWTSSEAAPPADYIAGLLADANECARWTGPSGWIYPDLLLDCEVWTSTVLAHQSLFEEAGVFDTTLRIGEDYDLWLRASRVTPILRVPRPLALYRLHPTSITKGVPEANHRAVVVERAIARWGYAAPDGRRARPSDVERALARTWRDYAAAHLAHGSVMSARHGSLTAVRHDPAHPNGWRLLLKSVARSMRHAGAQ